MKPEISDTKLLQYVIEIWIEKKIYLVKVVQEIAQKILEYGLLDAERTLPFQIAPTEFLDKDGDVICKLFANLDHPMYGFFTIEVQDEKCIITCPQIYEKELLILSHDECMLWLQALGEDMNGFYELHGAVDAQNVQFCQLFINDCLNNYHIIMTKCLEIIKESIKKEPLTALVVQDNYSLVGKLKNNYDRALLIPPAWVVFEDEDNLPDEGEAVDDYIDEEKTNALAEELHSFFKKESYLAAPIYLAQRICLQGGMKVQGTSISDQVEMNANRTDDGEFLLPPIDTSKFTISLE